MTEWIGAKSAGPHCVVGYLLERADMIGDRAAPKKLMGDTTMLLLPLYGALGGGIGAWVLVKPAIAIIEIGGTQGF